MGIRNGEEKQSPIGGRFHVTMWRIMGGGSVTTK